MVHSHPGIYYTLAMVSGSGHKHPWGLRGRQEPRWLGRIPTLCVLSGTGSTLFHQLKANTMASSFEQQVV